MYIEFLRFLLIKRQVNFYKRIQVSDSHYVFLVFHSMNHPKKSVLRSTLRGCRSCIHSIAVRLAGSTAPQGMLFNVMPATAVINFVIQHVSKKRNPYLNNTIRISYHCLNKFILPKSKVLFLALNS